MTKNEARNLARRISRRVERAGGTARAAYRGNHYWVDVYWGAADIDTDVIDYITTAGARLDQNAVPDHTGTCLIPIG